MGKLPDHEIAEKCGSTPSIVGRYRRKHGIEAYEGYKFGMGQTPPSKLPKKRTSRAAPAAAPSDAGAEAQKPPSGRSKLDPFRALIGKVPDAEVAAMAGVSFEAVRIYRRRHKIPLEVGQAARSRAAKAAKAAAEAAATAPEPVVEAVVAVEPAAAEPEVESAADAATDSEEKKPLRRASKLDPYTDLIGNVPDREVAAMAGVTAENVRAFRRRHDIPALWRDGADKPAAEPTPEPAVEAAPEPTPAPAAPRAEVESVFVPVPAPKLPAPRAGSGYSVQVNFGDGTAEYFIVSTDIASAAIAAATAVAGLGGGDIVAIRHLGPALL